MPAFVLVEIDITDPTLYEEYKKLTPASLEAYGGRFVVRGGESEVLEGEGTPGRLVVLEFKDLETAKRWWDSPEYEDAKALRQRAANTRMIAVEGVAAPAAS